ncbi:unnamed protein product, partial [Ixodes persulcatus]
VTARTAPREGGRAGANRCGRGSAHCAELILELAGATSSRAVAKRVRPEERRRRSHEPPSPEGGVRSRLSAGFPSRGRAKAPEGPLGGRPRGERRMDRRRGRDASLLPA